MVDAQYNCPYCTTAKLHWRGPIPIATCSFCRRPSVRISAASRRTAIAVIPVDTIVLVGAGLGLLMAISGYFAGTLSARGAITWLAIYMLIVGGLGVIEGFTTWRTRIYRTRLNHEIISKAPYAHALFNFVWGTTGMALGLIGLIAR